MLTISFIPYAEIQHLNSDERIKRILKEVKQEKIVLLEGKLRKEEEAQLIKATMEQISEKFKGIEIADVELTAKEHDDLLFKLRKYLIDILLGDRSGFTVIGPASIVKEIKKDPNKIELLTKDKRRR